MFCIVRDLYVASFTCGIIHFYGYNRSILHQHHTSLKQFHWFFTNLTWHTLERFISIIHLRKRLPNFPGSFPSPASEWRYGITRDERVRFWESETLCWIHCENNFMNSYVTTVAECNQKLIRNCHAERSHRKYLYISINGKFGHLLTLLLHSICRIQK